MVAFAVPVVIGLTTLATGGTVYLYKNAKAEVKEVSIDTANTLVAGGIQLIDGTLDAAGQIGGAAYRELQGTDFLGIPEAVGELAGISLDFIRGLGGAVIDGIDSAFDAIADRIEGDEPKVIAGITVSIIVIIVGLSLVNTARNFRLD
tara:strand:- start:382 stop:825 length:444 start_codon:yes stop_codon:yes gene_type:complete